MAKSSEEIHFARLLVNPDKSIRDKTLASVKRFIVRQEDSEYMGLLEMLKLWKALYYSLWLADSGNQADELAESIADLIIKLAKKPDSLIMFFSCLLKTVLREWSLLDQHRINKFYFLLRRSINKILSVCIELLSEKSSKKLNEKKQLVSQLLAALQEEALSHVPNGVRFHIADVFIPELVNVVRSSDGQLSLTTEIFMVLVAPFLQVLTTSPDPVFRERVYKAVFRTFLSVRGGGGGTGEQESVVALEGVDARELQRKVFSLASAEDTAAGCRQRLYDLHKEIAAKTGVAFVSEDASLSAAPVVHVTEQQQDEKGKQQGKKSKSKAEVLEVAVKAAAQEEEEEKEKAAVVKSTKAKRSAPTEPSTSALPSSQDGSSKKAKTEPVPDPSPGKAEEGAADFFASKKFTGSKEGFIFQKGPQGVGYYRDHPPQASKKASTQKQAQSQSAGKRRR
eukprot:gene22914-31218_t